MTKTKRKPDFVADPSVSIKFGKKVKVSPLKEEWENKQLVAYFSKWDINPHPSKISKKH